MTAPGRDPLSPCAFPGCGHVAGSHREAGEPSGPRAGCAILGCRCTAWTAPGLEVPRCGKCGRHPIDHRDGECIYPVTAEEYRLVLEAVREAIDIPHPATVGDGERHGEVLARRAIVAVVLLQAALDGEAGSMAASAAWCREELAKHPATGYRTWNEAVAERHAAEGARNQPQETTEGGTS